MTTHTVLDQYVEWFSVAGAWASELPKVGALIICLGVWIIYKVGVYISRLFLHPLSKYPGPRLAAASSLYEIYRDITKGDMTYHMEELHKRYGPIVRVAPNKLRLRKSSAFHEIHRIGSPLTKDPTFYHLFGLEKSTFSALDSTIHRRQRRVLDPMFSRRSIMDLEDVVQTKVNLLCEKMKELEARNTPVNFYNAFVALTTDVITDYAYAKSYNTLEAEGFRSKVFDAFDSQQSAFMVLKSFPIIATIFQSLPPWLLMKVFPDGAGLRELEVDAEVQLRAVFERTKRGEKGSSHRTVFEEILESHPDPKNVKEEDFVHEAVSVVGAGMHTTRWILCVGALRVAQNPEVVESLFQELKMAIPNVNDTLSYKYLEKLPYLRGVVNESLRLGYGVIGANPRLVPTQGAVIGGYHLPRGSVIEMDHYSISHDEEIFPDSHKFSPERWLGPDAKSKEKYVVAFSAGSRQCLGVNLAYCELYVAFAYLFRRFEVDATGQDLLFRDHWMPILTGQQLVCGVKSREE